MRPPTSEPVRASIPTNSTGYRLLKTRCLDTADIPACLHPMDIAESASEVDFGTRRYEGSIAPIPLVCLVSNRTDSAIGKARMRATGSTGPLRPRSMCWSSKTTGVTRLYRFDGSIGGVIWLWPSRTESIRYAGILSIDKSAGVVAMMHPAVWSATRTLVAQTVASVMRDRTP